MRTLAGVAVLLATVSVALVGVRLRSENRQLERLVWEAMRRRDSLATQINEVLSPRSLLETRQPEVGE